MTLDELNTMPENWRVDKLEEFCDVLMGQSPPSSTYNSTGDGLPFFQGRKDFGRKYPEKTLWCSDPTRVAHEGDVLLSVRAPVGDVNVAIEKCCIGRGVSALSMKNRNNDFLYYLMQHNRQRLKQIFESEGTVFGCVNKDGLKTFEVAIPNDPSEQRAIAKILSDLDEKIELNQRMIKTLESIAQALFKRWFVDFDFPDDRGRPYKSSGGKMVNSDLGESPEGWSVRPLDGIAEFLNGLALQKFPPKGDEYLPVIKIRELNQGITESTDKAAIDIDAAYVVNDGDVLFSWSGSLQVCIWCEGAGALNQHLFKVSSDEYPKWFYYQWVKFHLPEFQQIAQGKATTMGHIQRHHLSAALVTIPKDDILKKMNCVMVPLLEQIITNGIQVRKLSAIRDSFLPKLMSGEIRVNSGRLS